MSHKGHRSPKFRTHSNEKAGGSMLQEALGALKKTFSPEEIIDEIKWYQVMDLLLQCSDMPLKQYFDANSMELLDKKIEVLTALRNGQSMLEIPGYYEILELYPKNHT